VRSGGRAQDSRPPADTHPVRRLTLPALGLLILLAAFAVAAATTRGGSPDRGGAVPNPGADQVVDLSSLSAQAADERTHERPAERVTDDELASIERQVKERSRGAAAPDDGISPGAPSDKEVRAELRQMQNEAEGGPIKQGSGDMIWPIDGLFSSPFGMRWGRLHAGIDLAAPTGRPIRAAADGRVILAAPTGGYGNYTCVAHSSSISTCYAHQSRFGAAVGDSVSQGDVIGYVGNTGHSFGAHLHFEVRIDGRPVDPMGYL
jgi:murein DD-endopeptidase MepM/ murein hydrolase activator NlpD